MNTPDPTINKDVIHFAIMAIEASAELDGSTPREMYKRVEQTGVLKGLLFDLYDVEHTQSLQHVAEDVLQSLSIRE